MSENHNQLVRVLIFVFIHGVSGGFNVMMMMMITQITLKAFRACQVLVKYLVEVVPVGMGLE